MVLTRAGVYRRRDSRPKVGPRVDNAPSAEGGGTHHCPPLIMLPGGYERSLQGTVAGSVSFDGSMSPLGPQGDHKRPKECQGDACDVPASVRTAPCDNRDPRTGRAKLGGIVGVCQSVASVRADLKASCPTRPYEVVAGSNCLSGSINEAGEVVYIGGCLHSEGAKHALNYGVVCHAPSKRRVCAAHA